MDTVSLVDEFYAEFPAANGFVSRVVCDVADRNMPDARALATLLNEFFRRGGEVKFDGHSLKVEWPQ
jgi:hypothetical protein